MNPLAVVAGQRCIVPAEGIHEPNHETGKSVRWLIQQAGGVPMVIAGIYARWKPRIYSRTARVAESLNLAKTERNIRDYQAERTMSTSVAIDPETGAYVLKLPANVCEAAGVSVGQPLIVELVATGLLLRSARVQSLEQKLAAFDPANHGGEVVPDQRVGQERLPGTSA